MVSKKDARIDKLEVLLNGTGQGWMAIFYEQMPDRTRRYTGERMMACSPTWAWHLVDDDYVLPVGWCKFELMKSDLDVC